MKTLSTPEKLLLLTLGYCDQFDYPLTHAEISERFIGQALPQDELNDVLHSLEKKKLITFQEPFYTLSARQKTIATRSKRREESIGKLSESVQFAKLIGKLPWVKGVFVTGALAMMNAGKEDDLDFMIITAPKRLWLTRFMITLLAFLRGKKRSPNHSKNQSWCLNLWLTTENLPVPEAKRSIYTAYEVIQALPILGKGKTVVNFFQQNAWVSEFLPNWKIPKNGYLNWTEKPDSFLSFIYPVCNQMLYRLQWWYMKRHYSTEIVGEGFAFFHPRDTQHIILKGWKKALQDYLLPTDFDTIISKYAFFTRSKHH
jgi:hypothetical protein